MKTEDSSEEKANVNTSCMFPLLLTSGFTIPAHLLYAKEAARLCCTRGWEEIGRRGVAGAGLPASAGEGGATAAFPSLG